VFVCVSSVLEACPWLEVCLLACGQSFGGFANCVEGTRGRSGDNHATCRVIKAVHLLVLVVVELAASDH
jgi:hypothetical protein